MTAVSAPAHLDAGPSERAAAKRAAAYAETLEGRVYALVLTAGEEGLTAREALDDLGLGIERLYSVAPRLSALKKKGLVELTSAVRDNFGVYVAVARD